MFGWFRKRSRQEAPAVEAVVEPTLGHDSAAEAPIAATPQSHAPQQAAQNVAASSANTVAPAVVEQAAARTVDTVAASAPPAAPSLRPAMPLSDNPNFAGLGLAQPDAAPPRLLEPEAAFSDAARDELTALLLDMFGPRGRYRLEWRPDREQGDDAMFSEIMVADLVRRIQNSIAVASDLELRAAPLRLAIEAMQERTPDGDGPHDDGPGPADDATHVSDDAATQAATPDVAAAAPVAAPATATELPAAAAAHDAGRPVSAASVVDHRSAAISAFLAPRETLDDLAAATEPARRRTERPLHDVDDQRRIA